MNYLTNKHKKSQLSHIYHIQQKALLASLPFAPGTWREKAADLPVVPPFSYVLGPAPLGRRLISSVSSPPPYG